MKNKKFLSLVLAIAMLVSMFSVGIGSISAAASNFESGAFVSVGYMDIYNDVNDGNVREFITNFSEDELNGVTELWLGFGVNGGLNLTNDGIRYILDSLPNVTALVCSNINTLTDIHFIENNEKLTTIDIENCEKFADISPIATCPNLVYLRVRGTLVSDLSPAFVTGKLQTIYAYNNHITNITGLKEF